MGQPPTDRPFNKGKAMAFDLTREGGRAPLPEAIGAACLRAADHLVQSIATMRDDVPEYAAGVEMSAGELRAIASVLVSERRAKLTRDERAALRPLVAELAGYLVGFLGEKDTHA